jgi:hypothetical protein
MNLISLKILILKIMIMMVLLMINLIESKIFPLILIYNNDFIFLNNFFKKL